MTKPWPIHTIVFDLDDTLYAESEFVRSGIRAAAAWLQANHSIAGFETAAAEVFAAGGRGRIFDEALLRLGVAPAGEIVRSLVTEYRMHRPVLSLLPDACDALAWARSRFRLALLTDGDHAVQQRKIDALRLTAEFPCRILTDTFGREFWKPNPAGFREIMAQFPGAARGYVYVADNPRKDFIAPRALGWRTVRIRRTGGEHAGYKPASGEEAEVEIESLCRLKALLQVWPRES